jgi:hypothetical protein
MHGGRGYTVNISGLIFEKLTCPRVPTVFKSGSLILLTPTGLIYLFIYLFTACSITYSNTTCLSDHHKHCLYLL